MSLKFKGQDFKGIWYDSKDPNNPDSVAEQSAIIAQKLFDEWLTTLPNVYLGNGKYRVNSYFADATMQAKVVNTEPIREAF